MRLISIFMILIAMAHISCLDQFQLNEAIDVQENITVYGLITDDSTDVPFVRITTSVDFTDGSRLPAPIRGAKVVLVDDKEQRYLYNEIESGFESQYFLNDFFPLVGNIYKLEIELPDGKLLSSTLQTMPKKSKIEFLSHDFRRADMINNLGNQVSQNIWELSAGYSKPTDTLGFTTWRWRGTYQFETEDGGESGTSCWTKEYGTSILLSEEIDNNVKTVAQIPIESKKILHKYQFDLFQYYSSDNLIREFWRRVSQQQNNQGSIFDPTPVFPEGNVTCLNCSNEERINGIFWLASKTHAKIDLTRSTVLITLQPFSTDKPCETFRNTSSIKPAYYNLGN